MNIRLPVLLAASLLAAACTEPSAGPEHSSGPMFATTADPTRISGSGSIGQGPGSRGRDFREFNLDVTSALSGQLFYRDWTVVRPDGTAGWIKVSPTDPATRITAFRNSSGACSDPAHGVEFDGIGRDNAGGDTNPGADEFLAFTVWACDGAPPWSGNTTDYFAVIVPAHDYARGDVMDAGNLIKSAGSPPPPSVATRLGFTLQPSTVTAGWYISPAVQVTALDAAGNRVTDFTGTVVVTLGANPAGGTLFGTTSVSATGGVATFSELWLEQPGNGYTLRASSSGLTGATSATFRVRSRP